MLFKSQLEKIKDKHTGKKTQSIFWGTSNQDISLDPLRAKKTSIRIEEDGSDCTVSDNLSSLSATFIIGKERQGKYTSI